MKINAEIIIASSAIIFMTCVNKSEKKCSVDHLLALSKPQLIDYQNYHCQNQMSDTIFINNVSVATIRNNCYDSMFIGLYKTYCDSLFAINPSQIDYCFMVNDTFKVSYSDLIYVGYPDKMFRLTKGESASFFVLAKNKIKDNKGYIYTYSINIDSSNIKKTVFFHSSTLPSRNQSNQK